jgi:hypothetical protein
VGPAPVSERSVARRLRGEFAARRLDDQLHVAYVRDGLARAPFRCLSLTTAATSDNWGITTIRVKIAMRRTPFTSPSRSWCLSAVAV